MNSYTIALIFAFSIAIPGVIGLIRFRKIDRAYYPFIFCIWIGLLVEITSYIYIAVFHGHSNSLLYMFNSLAESILFTWFFKNLGLFDRSRFLFPFLIVVFIVFSVTDTLFFTNLKFPIAYFRSFYSFAIALMSIATLSREFNKERKNLLKNSVFIICITAVIYYTYAAIIGLFWLYGLKLSAAFRTNISDILNYINFFASLTYAIAILWMPSKRRSLSLS